MEKITIKGTDLNVSRICFGCCPMGGHGWGATEEDMMTGAVHTAIDAGVNFFDTADAYGLGKSESILSASLGSRRSIAVISTKFGVRVVNGRTFYDNSPLWIETACANSLRRLKTDMIDLYQIHYRDGKTPLASVVETLDRLREKGWIRYFGLSNIFVSDLDELREYASCFVSFQNEYSLACRRFENDIRMLADFLSATPLTWGSLGQGVLSGKYDKNTIFNVDDRRSREIYVNFHGKKLLKNLEIVEVMNPIAALHNVSITAVAVRFILDQLRDSIALVGAKSPLQVQENVQAMGWEMSKEEIMRLCEVSDG